MALSFDEILALAARKGPLEYQVKAWAGKVVHLRDPSSADVDEWKVYCHANQGKPVPFSAKLCQILLCDENGERIVPQNEDGLAALADVDAGAIEEIASFCIPLVNQATDDEIQEVQKN